jgi:hypothetical protein
LLLEERAQLLGNNLLQAVRGDAERIETGTRRFHRANLARRQDRFIEGEVNPAAGRACLRTPLRE